MDEYLIADSFLQFRALTQSQIKEINTNEFQKIPLTAFLGIGGGVGDFFAKIQASKQTGLFKVFDPETMEQLFELPYNSKKVPGAKVTSLVHANGKFDQGVLVPAPNMAAVDPSVLAVGIALTIITSKLDKIEEKQDAILNFLEADKRTKLEGTLEYLTEVFNNYRFSWNNERFKQSNHNQTQNIKRESEGNIKFYREQINDLFSKKRALINRKTVKNDIDKITVKLESYRLALYLYSFSSLLEVLLLENYEPNYLSALSSQIKDYAFKYSSLYTKCYNLLHDAAIESIESGVLKNLSTASSATGKFINKIPVIERGPVDEALINTGNKLSRYRNASVDDSLSKLVPLHSSEITQFSDVIDFINELHNSKVEVMVDNKYLYMKTVN